MPSVHFGASSVTLPATSRHGDALASVYDRLRTKENLRVNLTEAGDTVTLMLAAVDQDAPVADFSRGSELLGIFLANKILGTHEIPRKDRHWESDDDAIAKALADGLFFEDPPILETAVPHATTEPMGAPITIPISAIEPPVFRRKGEN